MCQVSRGKGEGSSRLGQVVCVTETAEMKVSAIWMALLMLVQLSWAITYEKALESTEKDGLLHLTDKNYKKMLKNDDFSLVIFFTADDPRVGCNLCQQFSPEYKSMVYQYSQNLKNSDPNTYNPIDDEDDKSRVIFAYADFMSARTYFELMQMRSVPRLFYYEPGKGPRMTAFNDEYVFLSTENLVGCQRWIAQNVPKLTVSSLQFTPEPAKSMFFTSLVLLGLVAFVAYKFRSHVATVIKNKTLWLAFCFGLIILFISGHMYNEIRHTESYKKDKNGVIMYFATGHNTQYGAETQIMSIVYGLLTFSVTAILKFLPTMTDAKKRALGSVVACVAIFFVYSYMIEAYRIKSPNYPLHLFRFSK